MHVVYRKAASRSPLVALVALSFFVSCRSLTAREDFPVPNGRGHFLGAASRRPNSPPLTGRTPQKIPQAAPAFAFGIAIVTRLSKS